MLTGSLKIDQTTSPPGLYTTLNTAVHKEKTRRGGGAALRNTLKYAP